MKRCASGGADRPARRTHSPSSPSSRRPAIRCQDERYASRSAPASRLLRQPATRGEAARPMCASHPTGRRRTPEAVEHVDVRTTRRIPRRPLKHDHYRGGSGPKCRSRSSSSGLATRPGGGLIQSERAHPGQPGRVRDPGACRVRGPRPSRCASRPQGPRRARVRRHLRLSAGVAELRTECGKMTISVAGNVDGVRVVSGLADL
jgi:hypothetical protein